MINYKRLFLVLLSAGIFLLLVDHLLKYGVRTSESVWAWGMAGSLALAGALAWLAARQRE